MTICYIMPHMIEEIFEKQKSLVTLKDIQTRIQNLEQQLSSSNMITRRLPSFFGTEPLLHQKGTTKVIPKSLTNEKK